MTLGVAVAVDYDVERCWPWRWCQANEALRVAPRNANQTPKSAQKVRTKGP